MKTFLLLALAICAQPETGKMVEVKTKASAGSLIVDPAETRFATLLWPDPSPTFKPIPFKGPLKGNVSRAVPLKDGGIALATSYGGFIISKEGDVKVMGQGETCCALAVSPTGEIAFGFSRRLPFSFPDIRGSVKEKNYSVLEIHVVLGPKPRTIVLSQQSLNISLGEMAFNADGSVLATAAYPAGITLIKGDKAWTNPRVHYSNMTGGILESNPADGNEFLYASYVYSLNLGDGGSFAKKYVGGNNDRNPMSLYGKKGEVISIRKDLEGNHRLYDGSGEGALFERGFQPRYNGVDYMAVSDKFVAYTVLNTVMVWSRAEKKAMNYQIIAVPEGQFLDRCVNAVAFRPNGELLVTTRNQVSEWNPETGKKTRTIFQAR